MVTNPHSISRHACWIFNREALNLSPGPQRVLIPFRRTHGQARGAIYRGVREACGVAGQINSAWSALIVC